MGEAAVTQDGPERQRNAYWHMTEAMDNDLIVDSSSLVAGRITIRSPMVFSSVGSKAVWKRTRPSGMATGEEYPLLAFFRHDYRQLGSRGVLISQ